MVGKFTYRRPRESINASYSTVAESNSPSAAEFLKHELQPAKQPPWKMVFWGEWELARTCVFFGDQGSYSSGKIEIPRHFDIWQV